MGRHEYQNVRLCAFPILTFFSLTSVYYDSVMIRPTEYDGVFSVMVGGKEADTVTLGSDREALISFVREVTKRQELEFGETRWLTEWR